MPTELEVLAVDLSRCGDVISPSQHYIYPNSSYSFTFSGSYLSEYINRYDYKPEYIFHKIENDDDLYFGAEIEIDNGGELSDTAKEIVEFMGKENVFCKHDGSLRNGFEIVTHPMTIGYHKSLPYAKLFQRLINKGYRSHDTTTCGLHIHFNRSFFGNEKLYQDLSISNMLYLFEKFWDKVVLVARRDSNRYAKRFNLYKDETPIDMYAKSKNASKYGAINLMHNDTVEIRIYKGTLNVDTFYNTIEFTKVFAELAKEVNIYNIQSVTWEDISSRFSNELKSYIESRSKSNKKWSNWGNSNSIIHNELNCSFVCERPTNLRDQMTRLQRQIRRTRNPLEQRQLQRELGEVSRQIGQNRHRN